MPTKEDGVDGSCSFISLDGMEFATGAARKIGGQYAVDHFVNVVGKDFDDARDDLKTHVSSGNAVAQIATRVTILDAEQIHDSTELIAKLSKISGLAADNIVVAYADKITGAEIKAGNGLNNALAIGVSKADLHDGKKRAAALGVPNAKLTIRALNAIGAVKNALIKGFVSGPVLCVSVLKESSQLFLVTESNVQDIGQIDIGYTSVLLLIMSELNLKFEGSAARLFFGNIYDFADKGESLSSQLASKLRAKVESYSGTRPAGLMLCGLPIARATLLAKHISATMRIAPVKIPTSYLAEGSTVAAMPVVGSPELAHLLTYLDEVADERAFLLDFASIPTDPVEYWKNISSEHVGFVRMYRGTAVDEHGNPIEIHHKHNNSTGPAAPEHKFARWYRGTPVDADETKNVRNMSGLEGGRNSSKKESAKQETNGQKTPAVRKIIRMYRGTAVYEDEV